ncbi:MAG TPA: glycosyltransferase 87 family protein [Rugosimonospora sp.]
MKRLVAAGALFAASVAGWTALVASSPGTYWQQSDAVVYREAGLAVRHGAALYAQTFGVAHLPFTYPPFAAVVFAAFSPLSFPAWQMILAGAGLCCLPLAAHAAVRLAAGPGDTSRTGRLAVAFAVAAVGLWLEPVDLTLHFGQINLILMALVLVDLAAPDTARYKGIGIGIAAGLKLTPLIFVPYLLLTRRVRAATVSAVSFAGTVALGFAVLGRDSAAYWAGQFSRPGDDPVRLVNQSLNGLVLRAFREGPDAHAAWIVAALATGALGIGAAVVAGRRGLELLGVCLCAATGLLVSPISWSHHWVYVLAGLALVAGRPARLWRAGPVRRVGALAAGTVLVGLFAWWPLRVGPHGGIDPAIGIHPSGLLRVVSHDNGAELRWTGWQLVYGDAYVLAALAFVLGSAGWLLATARRPRPAPGAIATGSAAPASAGAGSAGAGSAGAAGNRP